MAATSSPTISTPRVNPPTKTPAPRPSYSPPAVFSTPKSNLPTPPHRTTSSTLSFQKISPKTPSQTSPAPHRASSSPNPYSPPPHTKTLSQPRYSIQADFLPLYHQLRQDYPQFSIKPGAKFSFRPPKTIFLGVPQPNYAILALHELAHALCGHRTYITHVHRLKIESEAWQRAKTLCQKYHIYYDESFVEDQLDTYRAWLHQKSTCPHCHLTRFQTPDGQYHCPLCDRL